MSSGRKTLGVTNKSGDAVAAKKTLKSRSRPSKGRTTPPQEELRKLARKALNDAVTITEGGSTRQVTGERAMIAALVRKAVSGNHRAIDRVIGDLTESSALRPRRISSTDYERKVEQRATELFSDFIGSECLRRSREVTDVVDGLKQYKALLMAHGYRFVRGKPGDADFHDQTENMSPAEVFASLLQVMGMAAHE